VHVLINTANNKQQTAVTPQEKAKDLIRQFYSVGAMECKQCALIAVNEILSNPLFFSDYGELYFWQQVKKEIEKL
jgi:hypothetical protein